MPFRNSFSAAKPICQAFGILILVLLLAGCRTPDSTDIHLPYRKVTFGRFYGFCGGSDCLAMYRLDRSGQMKQDANPSYPSQEAHYQGNFKKINTVDTDLALQLVANIPSELWDETEHVLGCPDCADQGGIYLGVEKDNKKFFYMMDNDTSALPVYLRQWVMDAHQALDRLQD